MGDMAVLWCLANNHDQTLIGCTVIAWNEPACTASAFLLIQKKIMCILDDTANLNYVHSG
jgi:hypothetical protein